MTTIGSLIATGRTSDVFAFGADSVVKVLRPEVPPHWSENEATFTAAVHALGLPTPEVRGLTQVEGRPAIIFERIFGPSMWELMIDRPNDVDALAQQLGLVHQDIVASGLPAGLPGAVDRMVAKIDEVEQLGPIDRDAGKELVGNLPSGAALLHGDLHPGNVLMSKSGPIVIDWFDAAIGHPVTDAVRSSLLLRPSDRPHDRPHLPGASCDALRTAHTAYVRSMRQIIVASRDVVRQWEAVVALGRLSERAQRDDNALMMLWQTRSSSEESELVQLAHS